MKRVIFSLLALTLVLPASGIAKTARETGAPGWCGTRASTLAISYARHKFNQRRLELTSGRQDRPGQGSAAIVASHTPTATAVGPDGMKGSSGATVTKQKNIAVIEDDGTIFPPPNLFDLINNGVQFKGGPKGTRAERFPGGVSSNRGNRINIGDDASRTINLPFAFPFYGTNYNRVFLNSDGNLTFNQADNASTGRSLGRFLEGPPRIALDFLDLDPSVTSGSAGVYLLEQAGLLRVTWLEVPEFGLTNNNTFQVTLYPNGRVTMAYGGVDANVGIIGVSPGGPGTINLVDISGLGSTGAKTDAIAEQFREVSEIDDMAAAAAALTAVKDEYDVVVLFADFPIDLGGAFAYNAAVQNEIRGIGGGIYNFSNLYGSKRLRAFVQMGSLAKYPDGPNNLVLIEATGIGILAHEVGHRWLAFTRFINDQGQRSTDLLGRQLGHWSFVLDTDGSVMEGNDIRDNGDGTFTTTATWQGYSALDEYLMGLRRPDQVPPFFYVAGSSQDPEATPSTGVLLQGERVNVSVDQIIAAEGPRVPGMTEKPTQVFFVLLGRQGEPPSLDSIKKVNRYRNRLSTFYRQETEDRGRIATWLRLKKSAQVAPSASAALAAPAAGVETSSGGEAATTDPTPALTERFDRLEERR